VYAKNVALVLPKASQGKILMLKKSKFFIIMNYYTYVLRSESHGTFYYGHSEDLDRRLNQHNMGRVRYTKGGCLGSSIILKFLGHVQRLLKEKAFSNLLMAISF